MNERIRELAEQAGFQYVKDERIGWAGNYNASLPKFAELIVRECLAQVFHTIEDEEQDNISGSIRDRIKKHFGVNEQEKIVSKPKCSVCGTTENVTWMGGYQPWLCDSRECIPL